MSNTGPINMNINPYKGKIEDHSYYNTHKHAISTRTGNDTLEFSASNENNSIKANKKITFTEGCKLVVDGFLNKGKDILSSIVKKPVTTMLTIGATTAGLMALPLIGIPMATGAAVMAIGFGAFAIAKTAADTAKAIDNYSDGNNNELRKNLKQIGGDSLDLALSLPFIPKAINTVKSQFNYLNNGAKIGLNKELITQISKSKGLKAKYNVFRQAELSLAEEVNYQAIVDKLKVPKSSQAKYFELKKYNGEQFIRKAYDQLIKDMGYEGMEPELVIDRNHKILSDASDAHFSTTNGKIVVNPDLTKSKTLSLFRHELRHFEQSNIIFRTEDIGIIGYLKKQALKVLPKEEGITPETIDELLRDPKGREKISKKLLPAKDLYEKIVKSKGVIKAGTKEAKMGQKYLDALIKYTRPESYYGYSPAKVWKLFKEDYLIYRRNILEKEAWQYNKAGSVATSNIILTPAINSARAVSVVKTE